MVGFNFAPKDWAFCNGQLLKCRNIPIRGRRILTQLMPMPLEAAVAVTPDKQGVARRTLTFSPPVLSISSSLSTDCIHQEIRLTKRWRLC